MIRNLIFPPQSRCRLCSRVASQPTSLQGSLILHDLQQSNPLRQLCPDCSRGFERIVEPICRTCGRVMDQQSVFTRTESTSDRCADCRRRPLKQTFFTMNRSAVRYNDHMRAVMALYKYRGKESLLDLLGALLYDAYLQHYREYSFSMITHVPLHFSRKRERGFNQSRRLAEYLSGRTRIPHRTLLHRRKQTDKQSKKIRSQRLETLKNAFAIHPVYRHFQISREQSLPTGVSDSPSSEPILLIDDIYTTGSTAVECARLLKEEMEREVYVLTVAR